MRPITQEFLPPEASVGNPVDMIASAIPEHYQQAISSVLDDPDVLAVEFARSVSEAVPPLRAAVIPVTPLQQNCTLLWCTETMRAAFVDPGGDLPRLKAAAGQAGVTVEKILLTHGHIDHCGEAGILGQELGVPI
jgi:hypothetical protein